MLGGIADPMIMSKSVPVLHLLSPKLAELTENQLFKQADIVRVDSHLQSTTLNHSSLLRGLRYVTEMPHE